MNEYRDFTNGESNFPVSVAQEFLARLHAAGQHYVPIFDSNIYTPDPNNASDAYETFDRGAAMSTFIHNPDESLYYEIPYDGIWIDLSEASSFFVGSCGTGRLHVNPAHPPFALPGDPGNIDYAYLEGFNITNATEAASASSASMAQVSSVSATATSTSPAATRARTVHTLGVHNLDFPPYPINNFFGDHTLVKNSIAPNATHNAPYNTNEYEVHNLYGLLISNATYHALLNVSLNRRTFWGSMYFFISYALQFVIAGIPIFSVGTCGFSGNTHYELRSRWMQLSAFFLLPVADATRTTMQIRFSFLPYFYTLFYQAHTAKEMVMKAVAWEFPNEPHLAAVDNQSMLGPPLLVTLILVTLILVPQAMTVQTVFPGAQKGMIWYDWYTLAPVYAEAGINTTIDAPLGYRPLFICGDSILLLQQPGNTTRTLRLNQFNILIALDGGSKTEGSLYLYNSESLIQEATKYIQMSFSHSTLTFNINGNFHCPNPLANLTIASLDS
ncbi:MAG: hypothetical protein Q9170_005958 [Blastenia crenularia]